MKKLLALHIVCIVCNVAFVDAQAPSLQWQKVFAIQGNSDAFSTQKISDGGYIVAGQTGGGYGQTDFLVIRLDGSGNIVWQKKYGGTSFESAFSVQQTSDGGFIVAGNSKSNNTDVSGNHGGFDEWILKLDGAGAIQWQKSLGGSKDDFAQSIQQTTDGGYIVGGYTSSSDGNVTGNHGNQDYWVVKLDATGNIVWQKTYGGSSNEILESIRQTADGGYIAAGNTTSKNGEVTGVRDTVYGDFWIIKIDSKGNLKWQKTLGGSDYDQANSIQQTKDGGYFAAGWSRSTNGNVTASFGNYDFWVVKLDSSGNLEWQKSLGGSNGDLAYTAKQTPDGGYVIGGGTVSNDHEVSGLHGGEDFWIVKIDSTGNLLWQVPLGGSQYEEARSIDLSNDGGYLVAGFTNSTDGQVAGNPNSSYSFWVTKIGPAGSSCSCVVPSGGFSTTNITSTSATLHWNTIVCATGYQVQYRQSGTTTWTLKAVASNTGSINLTALKSSKTYQWEVATKCSNGNSSFSSVQKFTTLSRTRGLESSLITGEENTIDAGGELSTYISPNPASDILNLHLNRHLMADGNMLLRVINVMGQVLMEKNLNATDRSAYNQQLDISKLSKGIYFVSIRLANNVVTKKFIKE